MKKEQFRQRHGILIEHYQFIEMQLEGICACFHSGGFKAGLDDVEKTNLHKLFMEVLAIEQKTGCTLLTDDEKDILKDVISSRNKWVHECYTTMTFDSKTDDIKDESVVGKLEDDIRKAEHIRQRLFDIKINLMHNTLQK